MLKSKFTRTTSLVMVFVMLLASLSMTSCIKKNFWSISDDDSKNANILSLNVVDNGDGKYTISAISKTDIFKEKIENKSFCVLGTGSTASTNESSVTATDKDKKETTETKEAAEKNEAYQAKETNKKSKKIDDKYIKEMSLDSTYKFIDSKNAEFTVSDKDGFDCYFVYLHETATIDKKYAAGVYIKKQEDLKNIEIYTEKPSVNGYQENPTFDIVIKNAKLAQKIDKNLITTSQGFSSLTVSDVVRTTDTVLTVHTAGQIDTKYSVGDINFGSGVIDGVESTSILSIAVNSAKGYADFSKVSFNENILSLSLRLVNSTFNDNPKVTISGKKNISVAELKVNDDKTSLDIKLNVSAKDIATAVNTIKGSMLNIAANGTNYDNPISVELLPSEATLNANVDYIENSKDTTKTATVFLSASNGTLGKLAATDITIGGEFSNAKITEVKEMDIGTQIKFTFTTAKNIDDATLTGMMTITSDKLTNLWGTKSSILTTDLYYCSENDRAGGLDAIIGLWDTYGETIKTVASGASTAFTVGKTVLEMTGVIESTNAKIDKVYNAVVSLQSDVTSIKNELALAQIRLLNIEANVDKTKYDTAAAGWNNFYYSGDYKALQNKLTNYNNFVTSYVVSFLNGNKEVSVYYDKNGDITIPSTSNSLKSYRNIDIDSSRTKTYSFTNDQLNNLMNKSNNATTSYDGILSDLESAFKTAYPNDNLGGAIYTAFEMDLNYKAVNNPKISGADNAFTNACAYTLGNSGSKKPLEYFDEMLEAVYNFDSQTTEAKKSARLSLSATIMEGHALASLEMAYTTPYASYKEINDCYNACKAYLKSNTGIIPVSNGGQWSFVAGRELRLGYLEFIHYKRRNANVGGTDGVGTMNKMNGSISEGEVQNTMTAYGSVVNQEMARLMVSRAKSRNTNLKGDMLAAGYPDSMVNKSNWLITSSLKGTTQEVKKRENMKCVEIVHDSAKYYKVGAYYNFNTNGFDYLDIYSADITDPLTGNQHNYAEVYLIGHQWFYNFFEANDETYFTGGADGNLRYIKFY